MTPPGRNIISSAPLRCFAVIYKKPFPVKDEKGRKLVVPPCFDQHTTLILMWCVNGHTRGNYTHIVFVPRLPGDLQHICSEEDFQPLIFPLSRSLRLLLLL